MTCVSGKGMTPPGWKVTIVTCMSWRRSAMSTNRVVAHRPSGSGIGVGSTSRSLVTNDSGRSMPSTSSYALRIQWKVALAAERLCILQAAPGATNA